MDSTTERFYVTEAAASGEDPIPGRVVAGPFDTLQEAKDACVVAGHRVWGFEQKEARRG